MAAKNGETQIDGFDFKKLPRLDKGNEAIRRATLTNDEYEVLYRAMRTHTAKHNKIDDAELRVRKIVQHYVLIAANSGLRVGEQKQLRWKDVQIEMHKDKDGNTVKLARIGVRAATSKDRKGRTLLCRNGQYFERIQELFGKRDEEDLIFSIDGKRTINLKTLNIYFRAMLEEAEIADVAGRGIVLYSLRHFMITQRIMAGLSFRQVADMCGTSICL